MKNIDRLAKYITKYGAEGVMVHTIYGTNNWIIAQKMEINQWMITMGNPMGNVTYNLGTVSDAQHLLLWEELTKSEIEKRAEEKIEKLAKELKKKIP